MDFLTRLWGKLRDLLSFRTPVPFTVYVEYPAEHLSPELDNGLREIAESMMGLDIGSGSGFGVRDLEFEFRTRLQAITFIKTIEQLEVEGVRIDLRTNFD